MMSLWLNNVILIIVMVWLSKMTEGLFLTTHCLLLFNIGVLSNAYCVLTQTRLFGMMCLSRQVDPLSITPEQTMYIP